MALHPRPSIALGVALAALLGCPSTVAKAPVRPIARATAVPSPTPRPAASSLAVERLQRPAAPTLIQRARLTLDAAYMLDHVAGRIAVANGASSVVLGALGEAAVAAGGTIIGNHGGGVVANNGGNLIGNNGGGFISDQGGGLVAKNEGRYRVAAAGDRPAVGTLLPAAGMIVSFRSLRTGQPLALGQDGRGNPVYEVVSGADGRFEVYLPEGTEGNVLIDARPAASGAASPAARLDRKLVYEAFVPPQSEAHRPIGEDSTLVVQYIRLTTAMRLVQVLTSPDLPATIEQLRGHLLLPADRFDAMILPLQALRAVGDTVGIATAPPEAVLALTTHLVDRAISNLDLDGLKITAQTAPGWGDRPPELALKTLEKSLAGLREGARKRMVATPGYFDDRPYLLAANACKAPADRYRIVRPSDFPDFMVREYFIGYGLLDMVKVAHLDVLPELGGEDKAFDAAVATVGAAVLSFSEGNTEAMKAAFDLIRAFTPERPVAGIPPTRPVPASPCPVPSDLRPPPKG